MKALLLIKTSVLLVALSFATYFHKVNETPKEVKSIKHCDNLLMMFDAEEFETFGNTKDSTFCISLRGHIVHMKEYTEQEQIELLSEYPNLLVRFEHGLLFIDKKHN